MRYAIALNAKHTLGVRLNAFGHVAVGLAHLAPAASQRMRRFTDERQLFVGLMSDDPLIVLSARNGQHLRQAHAEAVERNIVHNIFVIDMKDGEPEAQQLAVSSAVSADLDYVAFGCWGDAGVLRELTRRFSLLQ
jgi:hypothetical protein